MKRTSKKVVIALALVLLLFSTVVVYAQSNTSNVIQGETTGKLIDIKNKEQKSLEDYKESYGSDSYGFVAYILNIIRIYSIPFCFVGIAVGAIYQYVIGIRKLDVRNKGFGVVVAFVTVLVICQILPLVFAIVAKGWRG